MDTELLRRSIRLSARAQFSRSGGPGGQNVNKVSSKVTLHMSVGDLAGLSETESARLKEMLGSRITGEGELVVTSSEERSQHINLERAYARMEMLIVNAARVPRLRRPTKPSRAARENRLKDKRLRALKKAERRFKP